MGEEQHHDGFGVAVFPPALLGAIADGKLNAAEVRMMARLYHELLRDLEPGELRLAEVRVGHDGSERVAWLYGLEALTPNTGNSTRANAVKNLQLLRLLRIEDEVDRPGEAGARSKVYSAPLPPGWGANAGLPPTGSQSATHPGGNPEPAPLARAGAAALLPPQLPPPPNRDWLPVREVFEHRLGLRNTRYNTNRWGLGHSLFVIGEVNFAIDAGKLDPDDRESLGKYAFTVGKNNRPYHGDFDDWTVLDRWQRDVCSQQESGLTEPPPSERAKAKGWTVDVEDSPGPPVMVPEPAVEERVLVCWRCRAEHQDVGEDYCSNCREPSRRELWKKVKEGAQV